METGISSLRHRQIHGQRINWQIQSMSIGGFAGAPPAPVGGHQTNVDWISSTLAAFMFCRNV
ncbi:MAG: hypothetical protein LIP12_05355 [Clostridiales bacterium]|nr:hypothetical protein [Clostridiales bacterium]